MIDAVDNPSPKERRFARERGATPAIDITMPCYNCARWLDASINSLLAQEGAPPWRLIVRDDASTDDTPARLAEWQSRLGDRMVVLNVEEGRNLGLVGNSSVLLAATEAAWVMTCDADDIWLPRRIAATLSALRQAEDQFDSGTPLAVCSDARVVNETGETLAASYWHWTRQDPRRITRPVDVAIEGVALSPTMAMNRALLDLALPIPIGHRCQDGWLALAAATFGRMIALPDQLVLYRRHSANDSQDPIGGSLPGAAWRIVSAPGAVRQRLRRILLQDDAQRAADFARRYRGRLTPAAEADMNALASLPQRGFFGRRATLLQHRLRFGSPLKNAGMWLLL